MLSNFVKNYVKKILPLIVFLCNPLIQGAIASSECGKDYVALVYNANNGNIIFEKDADKITYPASLVKLMTLYLTFEALDKKELSLSQNLKVTSHGAEIARVNNGNSLHLKKGQKITVEQAIRAVVVKSFNEAAVTLSESISGNEWSFVRLMNRRAKDLGMKNTNFRNASGLHQEDQYTTALDLARLAYAIRTKFPHYYPVFASKSFNYNKKRYYSHNHVLLDYKGAEGMKTGFTNASGFNLVASAKRGDKQIFSILMGCESQKKRDNLTKNLLDMAFNKLNKDIPVKVASRVKLQEQRKFDEQLGVNTDS